MAVRGLPTVSPSVRGAASWADERTLTLAPSRPLTPGTEYTARVDLRRIDEAQQRFTFTFLVAPREIAELDARFVLVAAAEPGSVRYQGTLRLTEPVEIPAIRRDASLVVDGDAVPLMWRGGDDGLRFEFVSEPVARAATPKDYQFLVQADRGRRRAACRPWRESGRAARIGWVWRCYAGVRRGGVNCACARVQS